MDDELVRLFCVMEKMDEVKLSTLQSHYVRLQQYYLARQVSDYRKWVKNMYVTLFNFGLSWEH